MPQISIEFDVANADAVDAAPRELQHAGYELLYPAREDPGGRRSPGYSLIGWRVFTGVRTVSVDFSANNSQLDVAGRTARRLWRRAGWHRPGSGRIPTLRKPRHRTGPIRYEFRLLSRPDLSGPDWGRAA